MKTEIIPAIMPESRQDLENKVAQVKDFVKTVQIDIMDGRFVPEQTWPYAGPGVYTEDFLATLQEEDGLPFWDRIDYEADLMIQNPENEIEQWIIAGVKRVIFHTESTTPENMAALLTKLRSRFIKGVKDSLVTLEIGLAINTVTSNDVLKPYIEQIDFVQFMGIETIGFQSQPFDERVLEKISTLRAAYPELIISVDGAVNHETAPRLLKAGANRLVSGSAVFGAEDIKQAIDELKKRD